MATPPIIGYQLIKDHSTLLKSKHYFIVAIGDSKVRERIQNAFSFLGFSPAIIIHPSAYISPDSIIGEGTVVFAKSVIETKVKIGKGVIIDIGALIDHDAEICNYCHVKPGQIIMPREKIYIV